MKSPEALEIGLRYAHPPPNSIQHTHALTLSLFLSLIRLKYEFVKMQEEEQVLRDKILLEGVETCMRMPKGEENKDDENKQCVQCMADCYLSAIMCPCRPNDVACLRHSKKISFFASFFFSFPFSFLSFPFFFSLFPLTSFYLCSCRGKKKILVIRYTLSELDSLLNAFQEGLQKFQ